MIRALAVSVAVLAVLAAPSVAGADDHCPTDWRLVGTDTFQGADALIRSQGVTTDGQGWIFSWQGGLERTLDDFTPMAIGTIPPQLAVAPGYDQASGQNTIGDNHIGDIDYYNGQIYAPVEDGGQDAGVMELNDPEYQHPHIAIYDAATLTYTGTSYALDVGIHAAGVPWVAIDRPRQEVYTAEWDMPHDRLNVFDLQMHFKRFLDLHYGSLGPGFRLSRIQGAKVYGDTMYATRDDHDKTVFSIDLRTGQVAKLFSLNPTVSAELEGLSVRPMPNGSLLHLLIVENNDLPDDATQIHVSFKHYAPVEPGGCS